ncbi:transporter substrate-binding domain-containing protein [Pseudomonas sp. BCA14]|uniref:ATP-binding protein n=1 Tax=unclassified Pseudomonas TaxID=196821 RepID=UPI00106E3129|nr:MULTISPECIES: transporter substrate-binding domain-containing protein [unclassified Pseudomonas]TFF05931.1 transporter substrate-binding domain-containing protein [Pseudomonas sp. JMN1]TFF08184.1 transporter substrate-binding domain-containing protein [Pseudomonas sp. BCA17]TFF23901.1 transporter substrate-binding domain-containing protein [Pseudomonas sp. BCA14]TFF28152.1 transporter substrate-binding domain-containing protein [Pseudomonas sp. BCA13]
MHVLIQWVAVRLACVLLLGYLPVGMAAVSLPFKLVPAFIPLEPLPLAPVEQQWLAAHRVLKVGISIDDYQPIDITRDRNRYQGISADYLSLVGARLGVPMQVLGFAERAQAVEALRSGAIDILTSANGYERNVQGLQFTRDYMPDCSVVVLRRDDIQSDDLAGKRVVLLDGYANVENVHAAYPDSHIMLAPNLYSGLEALKQGDADAFIGNEVIVRAYKSLRPYLGLQIKEESRLPPIGFAFATRRADPLLGAMMDRALESIDESVQREILARWTTGLGVGIGAERIELSASEGRWVLQHPHVVVVAQQLSPYVFKDNDARWVGLNVDLLNRISRMTGLQFVFEEVNSTAETLDWLETGRAEMNTTLAENQERRALLNFSHGFGGSGWVFVEPVDATPLTGLAQLAGKVLALPARHVLESYIRQEHPDIHLRLVSNYVEARDRVRRGEAAATLQTEAEVQSYPQNDLRIGRSVDGKWSASSFSVRKDQTELLSILNKALEAMPVAELSALRLRWIGAVALPVPAWQRVPAWVYWTVAMAILFVLVSLVWNSRLKGQIRQRLEAEARLNDQLAFKRALLDGMPNPLFVRDLAGRLVTCNKSYEQQLATRLEQIQDLTLMDSGLMPEATAARLHASHMEQLVTQQPLFVDRELEFNGGSFHVYQWTVPFFDAEGRLCGLLGGWIDINARKVLEHQLMEARRAADQASYAKSAFLSTLSHEIRTPMNAIIGLLELEQQRCQAAGLPVSEGLQVAHRSAHELIELMGDSLDLAKIEAGHMQLAPQSTELKGFFEGIQRLFEATAKKKDLHLTLAFDPAAQGYYWFDPLRLRQVMHNLLGNALKFTERGGVRVSVTCRRDEADAEYLHLCVEDSGPGIDVAQQARVFKPFVQSIELSAAGHGGTGLGLSICQQLVELMGGRIRLDSAIGEGTAVCIDLHLVRVSTDDVAATPTATLPQTGHTLSVLVVDDLAANRMVLVQQLQFLGHQVIAVDSAQAALRCWREQRFDVLVTDCQMPGMSGYGLSKAIRRIEADEQRPACLLIGCTANAMKEEQRHGEEAGMDELLVKPITLQHWAQVLTRATAQRSFDICTLRTMTQANGAVLHSMLRELAKSLDREHEVLGLALAEQDMARLSASLHRLKGICSLVDALPLARACMALESCARESRGHGLEAPWSTLSQAMMTLSRDLQPYLQVHD